MTRRTAEGSAPVWSSRWLPPPIRSARRCAVRTSTRGRTVPESRPASPGPAPAAHSSQWGSGGCPCPESRCCQRDLGRSPREPHCPSGWWHRVLSGHLGTGREMQEGLYRLGTLQMRPSRWGNRMEWWVGRKVNRRESGDHLSLTRELVNSLDCFLRRRHWEFR